MKKVLILIFLTLCALAFISCTTEKEITVSYLAGDGGYIEGETTQSKITGEKEVEFSTVSAIPNDGYKFIGWDDGKAEPTRQDTLTKDAKFIANFQKINLITVEYKAGEGGTIFGSTIQTGDGKVNTTQVKAIPNEGYRFVKWDDGSVSVVRNDEATENKVFTAIFQRVFNVEFTCDWNQGEIAGRLNQKIRDGMYTTQVYATPKTGYKFVGWSTGETTQELKLQPNDDMVVTAIFEKVILGLPTISIDTVGKEPIVSKDIYLDCSVSIDNTIVEHILSNESAKIKGRGNTSWESPKKPYKLKFDNEVNLFNNGEARVWTLIANYTDLSLIRNYLAYSVASIFDTQKITSKTQFVELYVNGEYLGVYLLCEQIEVHPNRVNIIEGLQIDTGYLIELDGRADGESFSVNGEHYVIKSPDVDSSLFSNEHKEFIQKYLETCLETLENDDYARIEELIDTKSFAQAYLVFELFNCVDVGFASFYMYKDAGGRLQCGPVWDFDRSLGITGHEHGAEPYDVLWAKEENTWFNKLLNHDEFIRLVASELESYMPAIKSTLNLCYEYVYSYEEAFERNFKKWQILGTYVWPNSEKICSLETWEKQVEYTREYLKKSLEFLKSVYTKNN